MRLWLAPAMQAGSKDQNKVDSLFNAYKKKGHGGDDAGDVMGPEGGPGWAVG